MAGTVKQGKSFNLIVKSNIFFFFLGPTIIKARSIVLQDQ